MSTQTFWWKKLSESHATEREEVLITDLMFTDLLRNNKYHIQIQIHYFLILTHSGI